MSSTAHAPPPNPLPRYFANDFPLSRRSPHKQLIASLTHLVNTYPPSYHSTSTHPTRTGGLYAGPTSIAYLFFTLSSLQPSLLISGHPPGHWCAAYLETSQNAMRSFPGPDTQHCGVAEDILALLALSVAMSRDEEMVREVLEFAGVVCEEGASDEWLYGRAGYLYLLRLMRASFTTIEQGEEEEEIVAEINATADAVIDAILSSPRPFKWHGKPYLGAAHGVMGIITQIVLTRGVKYAARLEAEVGVLLSYQFDADSPYAGNWPTTSLPSPNPEKKAQLTQFCHGAPGIVTSLVSIRPYFPSLHPRIDASIALARSHIWSRGLLTKEPCLCHGVAGNALCLGKLEEVEHLMSFCTQGEIQGMRDDGVMVESASPDGLWGGEAGRAWAWVVVEGTVEEGDGEGARGARGFLGYNDL